jgi:hypothetical protein
MDMIKTSSAVGDTGPELQTRFTGATRPAEAGGGDVAETVL